MIVIGYVFTLLCYLSYSLGRYFKQKKFIITLDLFSKVFMVISLYCFNSLSGAYLFVLSFINLIVCNIREYKHLELKFLFYIFQLAYIIVTILTYNGISSILVLVTSSMTLICVWFLNPQQMRIIDIPNALIFLIYQLSLNNYAGLLEIIVLISNITSYIKFKKNTNS